MFIINILQRIYNKHLYIMKNRQNVWAGFYKTGVIVAVISALTACGDSKEFTTGRAEDAIEELSIFQDSANVVSLQTGYYEENNADMRYKLRQLAANEMLTYSAEQINEYVPASYWRKAKTIPHVFVTVSLTQKGEKYIVSEPIKDKDADELKNKAKQEVYPESDVAVNEQIPLRNPQLVKEEENETGDSSYSDNRNISNEPSYDSSNEELSEYEKAKAKEHSMTFDMLSYTLKVYKVKNLICTEESMKEGRATCDAVVEVKDVTPFGRILDGVKKGDRDLNTGINFFYYIDKGWQVRK